MILHGAHQVRGSYDVTEIVAEGATYEEAKTALEKQVPDGEILIYIRRE